MFEIWSLKDEMKFVCDLKVICLFRIMTLENWCSLCNPSHVWFCCWPRGMTQNNIRETAEIRALHSWVLQVLSLKGLPVCVMRLETFSFVCKTCSRTWPRNRTQPLVFPRSRGRTRCGERPSHVSKLSNWQGQLWSDGTSVVDGWKMIQNKKTKTRMQ